MSNPIIITQCVVHDAKEAERYQKMGMPDEPPKKKVDYVFHIGDVKTLTKHDLEEEDETELDELTVVSFYDGQSVPVTVPFAQLSEILSSYHKEKDEKVRELMNKE